MAEIQAWFEPLLWIIGTIIALVAFIRFCSPLWKFFTYPKELDAKIEELTKLVQDLEKRTSGLVNQNTVEDSITLSLLHDSILQIYEEAKKTGHISEVSYYRACELYKLNGNSQYIDNIMAALSNIHEDNINKNKDNSKET